MHRNYRRVDKNLGKCLRVPQSFFYSMWKGHTRVTLDTGVVIRGFEDPGKQARVCFRSRQMPALLGGI